MTFVASLRRVLRRRRLDARLTFGPVIHPDGRTRRDLVALSHAFITLALAGGGAARRPGDEHRLPRAA
jgi:hypothetical protein